MYKTIYIVLEDSRETGLLRSDGISGKVCYSLKEVCEFMLRRVWYFEPAYRKQIKEWRDTLGPIRAWHEKVNSAWLYGPTYVKKRVRC